ncbi:reverse transcriptase [Gossypium australe]|uniref:Reverse transcriptase n=1 Tax=Gossypium australe TaxID=47621 RepID=A0A5B6WGH3_9ROSI|nr:reverse transcriptase [Gossypium australe]
MVGKVVKLDMNTDSRARGRFARMAVYIDLDKPLVSQILINGRKQNVEYESLSTICFHCGHYGHTKTYCPFRESGSVKEKEADQHVEAMKIQNKSTDCSKKKDDHYGPWMIVEKKPRRKTRDNGQNYFNNQDTGNGKRNHNGNTSKTMKTMKTMKEPGLNPEPQKEKNKENLPDWKSHSNSANGINTVNQARSSPVQPGTNSKAQHGTVNAGSSSSSSFIETDASLNVSDKIGTPLRDQNESTQTTPTMDRPDDNVEEVQMGRLDPERHSAVVFHEHPNSTIPFSINKERLNLANYSSSNPRKSFSNKGQESAKKHNKYLQGQTTRFKNNGAQRISLKESLEQMAVSLTDLSIPNFDSTMTNKLGEQNGKGCVSRNFLRAFREYNAIHRPHIVCLVEPRVSGNKANIIIENLGLNFSHRVEAVGYSGGIWVGWKDSIQITIVRNHPQFIFLRVDNYIPNKSFFISFVYGSPDRSKQKLLWEGLHAVAPNISSPWLIMGDFNAILSPADKKSPSTVGKRCDLFGNFVELLDRALANDAWMSFFPHCIVHHLTRIKSDHRPLLSCTSPEINNSQGRPFRFLVGWRGIITSPVLSKESANWNRDVYGFLGNRKRRLLSSLNATQKALEHNASTHLAKKEKEIRDELENVLDHEDLLWRQRLDVIGCISETGILISSIVVRLREGNSTAYLLYVWMMETGAQINILTK